MTAQLAERLRVRGRDFALLGTPLDSCPDAGVRERMRRLRMPSTAQRRGYAGDWEIKHERLWLVGLGANVRDSAGDGAEWYDPERGLRWLFPGTVGPVPADWFSGEIQSPRGRANLGDMIADRWPLVRVFRVAHGAVLETELLDNRARNLEPRKPSQKLLKYLDDL